MNIGSDAATSASARRRPVGLAGPAADRLVVDRLGVAGATVTWSSCTLWGAVRVLCGGLVAIEAPR
jgi:hypothetical protein